MTDDRRYQEDEIREIFDSAARAREPAGRALVSREGLTLAELKEIGQEVGLDPERVAAAAMALESRGTALPQQRSLGLPVSVGRVVPLPRPPDDREWEILVAELRETFGASGSVSTEGGLRQWSNGNLHALVEPTETGYRLRLGTLNATSLALKGGGLLMLGFGAVMTLVVGIAGKLPGDGIVVPIMFGTMGLGGLIASMVRLPGWARKREGQMEHIAGRALALLGGPAPDDATEGP